MFVFFKAPLEKFSPIIVMRSYFKVTKPLDPQNKTNKQDLLFIRKHIHTFSSIWYKKKHFFIQSTLCQCFHVLLDCQCLRLGGMQYSLTVTLCRSLRFQVLPVLRMRLWSGDHKATQTLRHGRHHSAQLHCGRQHTGADAPNASQRRLSVW